MIILDIDHVRDRIAVQIIGNRKEFYGDLNRIKRIPGAIYDPERRLWFIKRDPRHLKILKSRFKTAMLADEYELIGAKPPHIPTPVELIRNADLDMGRLIAELKLRELKTDLFDFQVLGALSAAALLVKEGGFIIADTMGLGKTAQAIAVVNGLKVRGLVNKTLVTCPKNVKYQWHHEVEKFSDLSSTVVDGYNKEKRLECFHEDTDIYIINHDQLIIEEDFREIEAISPEMIIVDEIHYFKNHDIKRTRTLKDLGEGTEYRLGLTGTPMQNNPGDLHSIFEFLVPGLFTSWENFRKRYVVYTFDQGYMRETGYRNLFELKKTIGPYMIRRVIDDVKNEMPEVKEKTHLVSMTVTQTEIHNNLEEYIDRKRAEEEELRALLQAARGEVDDDIPEELAKTEGLLMGLVILQMEVSDDLRLLAMSESTFVRSLVEDVRYTRSSKMDCTLKLLRSILTHDADFKVVLFSQFARMVRLLKVEIEDTGLTDGVSIVYGDLSEKERDREIQEFKEDAKRRVIVMSDAGAAGLNLEVASHSVNYDLPWNPATLNQRNGRIRRIGSPWETVYISNIVSRGSVDEAILRAIQRKRDVFERIVENTDEQREFLQEVSRQIM